MSGTGHNVLNRRVAPLTQDEPKILILAVLHSAIKDYLYDSSAFKDKNEKKYVRETAAGFLFDDRYLVDWGGRTLSPKDLLLEVDIEIDWVRDKIRLKEQDHTRVFRMGDSLV